MAELNEIDASSETNALPSPRKRVRLWLVLGVPGAAVVLGLALLAPVVVREGLSGMSGLSGMVEATGEGGHGTDDAATAEALYVQIPEIIANLSTGNAPRFVKVRVVARARSPEAAQLIRSQETELLDVFNGYLHALNPDEYFGAAGFERLRAGLRRRAELVLGERASALSDVLIVEFVRQ